MSIILRKKFCCRPHNNKNIGSLQPKAEKIEGLNLRLKAVLIIVSSMLVGPWNICCGHRCIKQRSGHYVLHLLFIYLFILSRRNASRTMHGPEPNFSHSRGWHVARISCCPVSNIMPPTQTVGFRVSNRDFSLRLTPVLGKYFRNGKIFCRFKINDTPPIVGLYFCIVYTASLRHDWDSRGYLEKRNRSFMIRYEAS